MNWIVFDVETTGLSPGTGHRIIEIGAVALRGTEIMSEFHSLIDCRYPISPQAQAVHGISARMLRGAPLPEEAFAMFRDFIGPLALVAHNAPFDTRFLRAEFDQLGYPLKNKVHCTLQLSRRHWPHFPNHKLDTVFEWLGGSVDQAIHRHRALDDARMTAFVWGKLQNISV